FFSSRRRHTRSYGDWSSDVCSSDLGDDALGQQDQRVLIAGKPRQRILRLEQLSQAPSQRQQDRIPDRDSQGIVDLLEAIEIDHEIGRASCRERVKRSVGGGAARSQY